jgi:hypothetical protein
VYPVCEPIQSSQYEALKEKLRRELEKYVQKPCPVLFDVKIQGEKKELAITLEKDGKIYSVQNTQELEPGRYKVHLNEKKYILETPWVEIKMGDKPQTLEIGIKSEGVDLNLVISYGAAFAIVLAVLGFLIRRKKTNAENKTSSSSSNAWAEFISTAKGIRDKAQYLNREEALKPLYSILREWEQNINSIVSKIELMPIVKQQEKCYYVKQELQGIQEGMARLEGMMQAKNFGACQSQAKELLEKSRKLLAGLSA